MVAPTPDPSPTGGGGAHFILVQQSFLPPVGEGSRIGELGERTECGGVRGKDRVWGSSNAQQKRSYIS